MRVVALFLMLLALPVEAKPRLACDTLGVRLAYSNRPQAPDFPIPGGLAQALGEVKARFDLQWVSWSLDHGDTVLIWPKGMVPVLYTPERLAPVRVFVVGGAPQLRALPLGRIDPAETWRKATPCRCSFIFAGYSQVGDVGKATRVSLEPASVP